MNKENNTDILKEIKFIEVYDSATYLPEYLPEGLTTTEEIADTVDEWFTERERNIIFHMKDGTVLKPR